MLTSRHLPEPSFRPDVNGLRGIAVLCVVLYHFGAPGFGGGYVGVDVFFVISGFLMTQTIVSKVEKGAFSVLAFYAARARRIVPALAALCLALLVAGGIFLLPHDYATLARQIVTAATFVSNVVFWRERGYFAAPSQEKFLLHTWSLSVEWQFYLLFPILVLLLHRWFGRKGIVAGLGAALLASLALNLVLTPLKPEAAFFQFPPRAWELIAGGFVYLAGDRLRAKALAPLGLGAIAAATLLFDHGLPFPGYAALLPVGGAAAIMLAHGSSRVLTNRPLQFLGDTSYSLYLVHWPLLVWLRYFSIPLTPPILVGLFAVTLALAYLSFRFVEAPFRKLGATSAPRRALALPLAPAAGVALLAAGVWGLAGLPSRVPDVVARNDAAAVDSGEPELCTTVDGVCRLGPEAPKKILFWGDSHVEHLYGALVALEPRAEASGQQLMMAVSHGCLPVRGIASVDHVDCVERTQKVWALAQDRAVETVVIGSIWTPYFRKDVYDPTTGTALCVMEASRCTPLATTDQALSEVASRLERDVRTLVAAGKRVTLVLPVPAYALPMARVLALRAWRRQPPDISLSKARHIGAQRMMTDMLRAVATRAGATIIDPTDTLCPGETCLFSQDGVSIYRDTNHLTAAGARLLVPALSVVLAPGPLALTSGPTAESVAQPPRFGRPMPR